MSTMPWGMRKLNYENFVDAVYSVSRSTTFLVIGMFASNIHFKPSSSHDRQISITYGIITASAMSLPGIEMRRLVW